MFSLSHFGQSEHRALYRLDSDCNRGVKPVEYHLLPWRKHSFSHLSRADAEIRIGDDHLCPFQLSLLSSKCKLDNWDSPIKLVPIRLSYADGASTTETGATYRNGCLRCGESRWIQTSAVDHDDSIRTNGVARSDWHSEGREDDSG